VTVWHEYINDMMNMVMTFSSQSDCS